MTKLRTLLPAILLSLVLFGCAAIEREEARDTEQLLAAAGFQQKVASTPEQAAQIVNLPQDTLVRHDVNGSIRYTYSDAKGCNCLYAGDEAAYDRYQNLAEQRRVAEMNQEAEMNWDMWGPWGGGFGWGPGF